MRVKASGPRRERYRTRDDSTRAHQRANNYFRPNAAAPRSHRSVRPEKAVMDLPKAYAV